jgi:import receptor subunit TOM70
MAPAIPPSVPIPLGQPRAAIQADPSLWDRISTWVSENKAVVYTIVGVTVVVTTAGAVYYIKNNSVCSNPVQVIAIACWGLSRASTLHMM